MTDETFIPGTREISVGRGVVYRPIRSWHSGVYAGEGMTVAGGDASGCLVQAAVRGRQMDLTFRPKSVTHRLYWNVRDPARRVSAFLSYPNGMGCCDSYFWEAMLPAEANRGDGIGRYDDEAECEAAIVAVLGDPA